MEKNEMPADAGGHEPVISLDRHSPVYRTEFQQLSDEFHAKCPVAWNDTADQPHWFASGNKEVFDLARRADLLSNDNDLEGVRKGYRGVMVPAAPLEYKSHAGFLEMDPPDQRYYRQALNPYLSPAAIARWRPVIEELTRACIDERIETGSIDFVDDLANIVPAVFTLAMLGMRLKDWEVYCEPMHALVYTPPDSPDAPRVYALVRRMGEEMVRNLNEIRANPRPGLLNELAGLELAGGRRPGDEELMSVINLLIGGGFDTTTALTAHSLEWLSEHPSERERLSRERDTLLGTATEEFLRYYTPAQGDGRNFTRDCEVNGTRFKEGERVLLSWAMANRDEKVFPDPHTIRLDRPGNRHASFGLGIHRCIGSNVARATFKTMLTAVLDRMPDYVCDPAGAVHYESIGVINGMQHLPATFTPGRRLGAGLEETIDRLQRVCDEQRLAEPVTVRSAAAKLDG